MARQEIEHFGVEAKLRDKNQNRRRRDHGDRCPHERTPLRNESGDELRKRHNEFNETETGSEFENKSLGAVRIFHHRLLSVLKDISQSKPAA